MSWIKKRELAKPGAITSNNATDPPLVKAIDRYSEESLKDIGRTKAQVPRAIKTYPTAEMPCSAIKSNDIIEFLQSLTGQPQTAGKDSHLAAVVAVARPMWDYRLSNGETRDAIVVARRMGIISCAAQRDRRPALGSGPIDHPLAA